VLQQEEEESLLEEDDVSVPSSIQLFKDAGDTSSIFMQISMKILCIILKI
jgi:hypothetical protein